MHNPVVHWEIAVKDLEKAKKFYTALFHFAAHADPGDRRVRHVRRPGW